MSYGIIYKAVNKVNYKPYIGQTTDFLNERISRHFYRGHVDAGKDNSIFHKALLKYGRDNFSWTVICECDSKLILDRKEKFYIRQFNSHYKDGYGYNMTYGGEGSAGFKHSEETKRKLSILNRRPSSLKGKKKGPMSLMVRMKISQANKGKTISKETRKKLRLANLGKHHTEATKEKLRNRIITGKTKHRMSLSRMGKSPWNLGLKITPSEKWIQRQEESHSETYEVDNNGVVFVIKNLSKYCRNIGINKSSLLSAVRKGNKYRGIFVKRIA